MEDGRVYRPSQRLPPYVRMLPLGDQLPEYLWGEPLLRDHFQYLCSEAVGIGSSSENSGISSSGESEEFEDCVLISHTRLVKLINHNVHDIIHLSEVVSVDHYSDRRGSLTCYYLHCDLLKGAPMHIQVPSKPVAKFLVGVIQSTIKRNMIQMGLGVQSMIYNMLPKPGEKLEDVLKPLDRAWHMIGCVPAFQMRSRRIGGVHRLERTEAARALDQSSARKSSLPSSEDQSFEEFILSDIENLIHARVRDLLASEADNWKGIAGVGGVVVEEKKTMQAQIAQVDEVIQYAQKLLSPIESKGLKERIMLLFHHFLRPKIKTMSESIILSDSIACIKWLPKYEKNVRSYLVTEVQALEFEREMETRVGGLLEVFHANSREKFQGLMNGVLEQEKKNEPHTSPITSATPRKLSANSGACFIHSSSPHDLFELVIFGSFNHATKAGINGRALLRHAETLCMILQSFQHTLALEYRSPHWVRDNNAPMSDIMSKNVKITTSGGLKSLPWVYAQLNNAQAYLTHTDDFQSLCEQSIVVEGGGSSGSSSSSSVNGYLEESFEVVREGFENLAYDALNMLVVCLSEATHFLLHFFLVQTDKIWKKKSIDGEKIKALLESLECMLDSVIVHVESLSHKEMLVLRFLPCLTGHYLSLFVEHASSHPGPAEIEILRTHAAAFQTAFESWCGDLVQKNVVANRFQDVILLSELFSAPLEKLSEVVERATNKLTDNPVLGPVLSDFLSKALHRKGGSGSVALPPSLNYTDTQQKLVVSVLKATHLAAMDDNGLSDPFCQVSLTHPSLGVTTTLATRKTKTVFKTLNPVWNERIEFEGGVVMRGKTLVFSVWDYDYLKSPDLIGEAELSLDDIREKGSRVMTLQLRPASYNNKKKRGSVRVGGGGGGTQQEDKRPTTTIHSSLRRQSQETNLSTPTTPSFLPLSSASSRTPSSARTSSLSSSLGSIEVLANFVRVPQTECLLITVEEARGLKVSVDKKGTSDPICKVEITSEGEKVVWKGETQCIKETLSPKWMQTFEVKNIFLHKIRYVHFTVYHKDIFAMIGDGKFLGMHSLELPQGVSSLPTVAGKSSSGGRRGSGSGSTDEKYSLVLPLGKGTKKENVTGSLVVTLQHRSAGSKTAFDEMAASQLLSRREELFMLKQQKANHAVTAQFNRAPESTEPLRHLH